MPPTADPNPVKTFDVLTTYPGRAIEPVTHFARTASTEGGVLTLRGTADSPFAHVISYGPGYWVKYTTREAPA